MNIQSLLEAREDYIAQQLGPAIMKRYHEDNGLKPDFEEPIQIVKYLSKIHPKYIQWIVKHWIKSEFKLEDRARIKEELENFDKYKSRLEIKDINQYYSLRMLLQAVTPFMDQPEQLSIKQLRKQIKKDGANKLIDENGILMYEIKTKEAACLLGAGTRWCTAAKENNMFTYYHTKSPLYVIIKTDTNEKFQLHLTTGSFMNAEDIEEHVVNVFSIKQITLILDMLMQLEPYDVKQYLTSNSYREEDLISYLSPEATIRAIQTGSNGTFFTYIHKNEQTKEICSAAFKKNPNSYVHFDDKFKTIDFSVKYAQYPHAQSWEAIPKQQQDYVRKYIENIKQINKSVSDLKSSKNISQMLNTMPPEKKELPDVKNFIDQENNKVQQSRLNLRGFKDSVKQLRQQKQQLSQAT